MSNNDFDRAVNFLQGALNVATSSAAEEPKASEAAAQESQVQQGTGPLLPGFDQTPAAAAEEPSVVHIKAEKNPLELRPPAQKRAARAAQAAQDGIGKTAFRINATTSLAALSGVLGIAFIIACICLMRTPSAPAVTESNDIPFALLPETADSSLWDTVAKMSGEIDGVPLQFERGIAVADGVTYKLQFDFCRSGSEIYAKVSGDKTYVVRLDEQGKITKAYPAPKNNRPLKDIFAK